MITDLSISNLHLNLHTDYTPTDSEPCHPFVQMGGYFCVADSVDIRFLPVKQLPPQTSPAIYQGLRYQVFQRENGFVRYYTKEMKGGIPYAYSRKNPDGSVTVLYLEGEEAYVRSSLACVSHIGFEDVMMDRNRMILHSSCVSTRFGGVLFSGHSGIGKSTQADLWKTLEGAEIINGDRTILYQENGVWMGSGSPYAGSSRYFVNKQIPLKVIVMLDQTKTCSIRRLHGMEAFRSVFVELLLNSWNSEYMEKLCDMCEQLITEVPVYRLACTPDASAIEILKSVLE